MRFNYTTDGRLTLVLGETSLEMTWDEIIDDAEQRGAFTDQQKFEATVWTTCAVGECLSTRTETREAVGRSDKEALDRAFDRAHAFSANLAHWNDSPLFDLGIEFCGAVKADNFHAARTILASIRAEYAAMKASGRA